MVKVCLKLRACLLNWDEGNSYVTPIMSSLKIESNCKMTNRIITLDEDSLLPLSAHTYATGIHHPKDQPD
jgi:hypothetical protein